MYCVLKGFQITFCTIFAQADQRHPVLRSGDVEGLFVAGFHVK